MSTWKWVAPPPPAMTVTWRDALIPTTLAFAAISALVNQLIVDDDTVVLPPGFTVRKPSPTVFEIVMLYDTPVAPAGTRLGTVTAPPLSARPSATLRVRLCPLESAPSWG